MASIGLGRVTKRLRGKEAPSACATAAAAYASAVRDAKQKKHAARTGPSGVAIVGKGSKVGGRG